MATYKVLQDIEAEDKLLGPLTLKQFIFALVACAIGFVEFKLATTPQLSVLRWPFVIVLLLPMGVFGFLAAPISRDQPNDIWLLARMRFLIKPHIRIWNQDGISELVTITVPKKLEQALTDGLDQTEVKSRLSALASTMDSRGWAVKNVDVNMFGQPSYLHANSGSDRLVAPSTLPATQQAVDVRAADDMLDADSNPVAQHLDQMVQASTARHQQAVRQSVKQSAATSPTIPLPDYSFLNSAPKTATPAGYATFQKSQVVAPGSTDIAEPEPTAAEKALIAKIEADNTINAGQKSHLKTIQPLQGQRAKGKGQSSSLNPIASSSQQSAISAASASGTTSSPAILNLAHNDDFNVATIARQAKRISEADDEVVISLH